MENNTPEESSSSEDEQTSSGSDQVDEINSHKIPKRSVLSKTCGSSSSKWTDEGNPKITWPPPVNSSNSQSWPNLKHVRLGNPLFGTRMQLFSKTNHHLAVYPDGSVRGTNDENDIHTYLELISAQHPGHVKIKGLLANLYVAMDQKGRLYGEPVMSEEATVFIESFQGSYSSYLSKKFAHLGWYLGIKKSGKFKKGPKTKYGQKAILFLPRRSKFE